MRDLLPQRDTSFKGNNSNSGGNFWQQNKGNNPGSASKRKSDYCWNFNKGLRCKFGSKCRFIEQCSYCDASNHGVVACPKLEGKKQGAAVGNAASPATRNKANPKLNDSNLKKKLYVILFILFYSVTKVQVDEYQNFDVTSIVTPVDVDKYEQLLKETKYDAKLTEYLVKGFGEGFSLNFSGKCDRKCTAPNLPLHVGSKVEIWNKVMAEVKAKRYMGPFTVDQLPFKQFIQSPMGLVPKDKGTKTRLIFHLSFPKNGDSVNSGIPHSLCTVKYPQFDEAIKLCIHAGKSCHIAKSDMSMAFQNVPLSRQSWHLLVLKCQHPTTEVTYWFFDKCLPFGSSISCKKRKDWSTI